MKPRVIWLTGLSGAGKSMIAQGLASALLSNSIETTILDGDTLRTGLNRDLGFTKEDRVENIRRTAEVAKLLVNSGSFVIVALISPFIECRQKARELFKTDQFLEVYISTPIEVCIQRDPKGLYAKAINGDIKNFTGIDSPYEAPNNPELALDTQKHSVEELVQIMLEHIKRIST